MLQAGKQVERLTMMIFRREFKPALGHGNLASSCLWYLVPIVINSYCTSKIWFKTGNVDLRLADITAITSKVKSYCYQDLFQKPSEVLLYRQVEEGGLGLLLVQSKAQAHLIATFLQTASTRFRISLFHSWMFRFHIEGDTSLPGPGYTP